MSNSAFFCRFVIWSLFGKRPETSLANWGSRDNYGIPLVKFLEKAWGRKVVFGRDQAGVKAFKAVAIAWG